MSSGQFNRGKGKRKAITGIPRRERGSAIGNGGTPAHTPIPSSNSIASPNFGDYVPENIIEEQINEMFEASKLIHNIKDNGDDEQEQPVKSKQRKLSELKSPLFAVHYSKMDDVESGPGHFFIKCKYCDKIYKFRKGGGYGTLNGHLQRRHSDKVGIESNQTQLRGTATSSNALNQGGYGTLNEIFNITSWTKRDFHTERIGVLNTNKFFSDLLAFLDQGVEHKFISQPSRDILICADTIADLLINFKHMFQLRTWKSKLTSHRILVPNRKEV
ncbi:hypothetical protein OROMI_022205 [Orobanche minor]